MTELIEQVRWDIEWRHRNDPGQPAADDVIDKMTPLELLAAISNALETIRREDRP